jgi:hypothetical protein
VFWTEDTEADECETTEYTRLSENCIDFEDEVYQ